MKGGIVITGASTGIGRECALHLDEQGFLVFAGVRRDADAEALRRAGSGRLTPILVDVTDAASIEAAVAAVRDHLDGASLVGLVNNAGIAVGGPIEVISVDELRWQFEVNFFGQVAVTRAFLPLLRDPPGRIVNMGSINGRLTPPFQGPYSASKHALRSIGDALRQELRPEGIAVALIEPGAIRTPIWQKAAEKVDEVESRLVGEYARYGPFVAGVRRLFEMLERDAVPASEVAKAVEHALTARRPKTRYLVGRDARVLATLRRVLSDRMLDGVFRRGMAV